MAVDLTSASARLRSASWAKTLVVGNGLEAGSADPASSPAARCADRGSVCSWTSAPTRGRLETSPGSTSLYRILASEKHRPSGGLWWVSCWPFGFRPIGRESSRSGTFDSKSGGRRVFSSARVGTWGSRPRLRAHLTPARRRDKMSWPHGPPFRLHARSWHPCKRKIWLRVSRLAAKKGGRSQKNAGIGSFIE